MKTFQCNICVCISGCLHFDDWKTALSNFTTTLLHVKLVIFKFMK